MFCIIWIIISISNQFMYALNYWHFLHLSYIHHCFDNKIILLQQLLFQYVMSLFLIWRCPNKGYRMCGRFSEISLSNLCWIYNASWVSFKRELLYLNETFPGSYLLVIYPLTWKWHKWCFWKTTTHSIPFIWTEPFTITLKCLLIFAFIS